MFIREITNNIKQPIVENPLGWAALDLLFGAKSTAGPRHSEMGAGDILYRAIEGRVGAEQAENIAQDFETKMRNPATADRAWSQWEELTGEQRTNHFDYQPPAQPYDDAIMRQARKGEQPSTSNTTKVDPSKLDDPTTKIPQTDTGTTVNNPLTGKPVQGIAGPITTSPKTTAPKTTAPKPAYDDAILRQQKAITAQAPNLVKDAGAAQAFAQSSPKSATDIAQGITSITKGAVAPTTVQQITQGAIKYGLPAAGIVALLYGGKKLFDYVSKKNKAKKEGLEEEATAGATSAGNIASVANPKAAYFKPKKRGKYGAPQAPQRKNPDGTAKSALDVTDSLMGNGKVVKR
jgi:hypothetical protein